MENILVKKYNAKAKDSFKTKMNLFIFSLAIDKKTSFTTEDFGNFQISSDLVTLYSAEYWQRPRDSRINDILIDDLYKQMIRLKEVNKEIVDLLEHEYLRTFSTLFPENEFEKLLSVKRCHYCGVSIEDIVDLSNKHKLFSKNERGRTLEIDRLNSNFEYTPKNCVMACYWCNNAKTDEFTEEEFKNIGTIIGTIWKGRII
jgi:5-methylcytosine-specific restriction endonuclease McrA